MSLKTETPTPAARDRIEPGATIGFLEADGSTVEGQVIDRCERRIRVDWLDSFGSTCLSIDSPSILYIH